MNTSIICINTAHLAGESAMPSPAPRSPRHAALLLLAHIKCAASSRLAWHADHDTGEGIQLLNLGLIFPSRHGI
ncbi:hypothetical protein [Herbaspirillum sp.]|uniref:hypothetical protein n=1 Tax=Herbaspirillum sp. TaxID=1890675 RepID=UPI0031DC233E